MTIQSNIEGLKKKYFPKPAYLSDADILTNYESWEISDVDDISGYQRDDVLSAMQEARADERKRYRIRG